MIESILLATNLKFYRDTLYNLYKIKNDLENYEKEMKKLKDFIKLFSSKKNMSIMSSVIKLSKDLEDNEIGQWKILAAGYEIIVIDQEK